MADDAELARCPRVRRAGMRAGAGAGEGTGTQGMSAHTAATLAPWSRGEMGGTTVLHSQILPNRNCAQFLIRLQVVRMHVKDLAVNQNREKLGSLSHDGTCPCAVAH